MKSVYYYLIYFLLLVPPLVFFTDTTRNPYYFQIVLVNSGTVLLWMLWLYDSLQKKTLTYRKTPLDLPLCAFFVVATVSWIFMLVNNINEPYLKYSIYNEGLKRWFYLLANAVLVYYAAVNFTDDNNRVRFISAAFFAVFIAACYGILQYFGIELIWPKVLNPFGGRSVSTFGNPNFLSSYLVLILPVIFVFYVKSSPSKRIVYLVLLLTCFSSLLCTMTRSSWLGSFVAMTLTAGGIWVFDRSRFKDKMRLILMPFALFLLLMVFWPRSPVSGYKNNVFERLTEVSEVQTRYYGAWHQRRLIWSCAWHMIIESPVLGKGWGCFELFYPSYQGRYLYLEAYQNFRTHANNTHNEILEIWSQTGTVGFGVYLWFLFTVVSYGLFIIKNQKGEKKLLAIAFLASLLGMWADNLLNVSLHFAIPGFLYWWNLGLLVSLGNNQERSVDLKPAAKQMLVYLLIIGGGISILRYTRNFLAEVHYFKGFKYSKRNDIQRAIPELEKAHNFQRLEVNNNYELANCYARSGMRDKAIWAYKESLRANAGYDEIYFNMATVLVQMGKTEEAIPEYTRSLYINSKSFDGYTALGSIFLQDPDRYNAPGVSLFKQCTIVFPENKDIWNNLGYLYIKSNRNEEALAAYKKALDIDPDFELAKRNVRVVLSRLGRTDKQLEEVDGLFRRVEDGIGAKRWDSIFADCKRLAEIVPRSFKARLYLANISFTLSRFDEAVVEYEKALELKPDNISALINLSLVYFQTKKYNLAKEGFNRILKLDPENNTAKQKLAEIQNILFNPIK